MSERRPDPRQAIRQGRCFWRKSRRDFFVLFDYLGGVHLRRKLVLKFKRKMDIVIPIQDIHNSLSNLF
jgi:hypothetical protein